MLKVGTVAYGLELQEQLSKVHSTFHVSNLKNCLSDETLAIPLDEIQIDDILQCIEEPVKITDHKVKRLKQSRIHIVKVRLELKERSRVHLGMRRSNEEEVSPSFCQLCTRVRYYALRFERKALLTGKGCDAPLGLSWMILTSLWKNTSNSKKKNLKGMVEHLIDKLPHTNSFSYKIISVDNLKMDLENENDKVNMPSSPGPPISHSDDLDFFKDLENEFPTITYIDDLTFKLTEPSIWHLYHLGIRDTLGSVRTFSDNEIKEPLVREFILEFLSICRMSDTEMGSDVADTLCFQLCGVRRRMTLRQFILALGLHTDEDMACNNPKITTQRNTTWGATS
nr:putative reverse transcriptase domain-containing protein [Tanacetum cinerariifolium]